MIRAQPFLSCHQSSIDIRAGGEQIGHMSLAIELQKFFCERFNGSPLGTIDEYPMLIGDECLCRRHDELGIVVRKCIPSTAQRGFRWHEPWDKRSFSING